MDQRTREKEILDKAGVERKTVYVVDWDGVCTEATWPEWGDWLPGAVEGLRALLQTGEVRISSSRLNPHKFGLDGIELRPDAEVDEEIAHMRAMLDAEGLDEVVIHTTLGKPSGTYYIDDRAVEFDGDWSAVLERVGMVPLVPSSATMRAFDSGATRNVDTVKHDYEGFLSPIALRAFGRYMHEHRVQKDGSVRDSDNWQKGIPLDVYMKSAWRHFFDLWELHRDGHPVNPDTGAPVTFEEALMGLYFNVQGYAHEKLKEAS